MVRLVLYSSLHNDITIIRSAIQSRDESEQIQMSQQTEVLGGQSVSQCTFASLEGSIIRL